VRVHVVVVTDLGTNVHISAPLLVADVAGGSRTLETGDHTILMSLSNTDEWVIKYMQCIDHVLLQG
jgi:hypothetical protein